MRLRVELLTGGGVHNQAYSREKRHKKEKSRLRVCVSSYRL